MNAQGHIHEELDGAGRLVVAGIGGAASQVLECLNLYSHPSMELVAFNTDRPALERSSIPTTVLLGSGTVDSEGFDARIDDPAEVELCAETEARSHFSGADVVILLTALGGGTGGLSPILVEAARGAGATVFIVAILPFSSEAVRRGRATQTLRRLQESADLVITFDDDHLLEVVPKLPLEKVFDFVDSIIVHLTCSLAAVAKARAELTPRRPVGAWIEHIESHGKAAASISAHPPAIELVVSGGRSECASVGAPTGGVSVIGAQGHGLVAGFPLDADAQSHASNVARRVRLPLGIDLPHGPGQMATFSSLPFEVAKMDSTARIGPLTEQEALAPKAQAPEPQNPQKAPGPTTIQLRLEGLF